MNAGSSIRGMSGPNGLQEAPSLCLSAMLQLSGLVSSLPLLTIGLLLSAKRIRAGGKWKGSFTKSYII